MKATKRARPTAGIVLAAIVLGVAACSSATTTAGTSATTGPGSSATSSTGPTTTGGASSAPTTTAPAAVVASALTAALTAEHQAKSTYDNVVAKFGDVGPFSNVSAAESGHIATLEALAKNHGVTVPTGSFPGQAAPATLTASCQLGVSVEQGVVAMYTQLLAEVVGYGDLTQAFDNLKSASQDNHLPAFEHCA